MIDLRRLSAFVTVVEERHVTRAAERLGMQQPPLSRLLRGLEAELGVVLLRRLPRGVEPTDAGRALFEEARAVLARAACVDDAVRRAARGEQGRLSVGFTSSAGLHPFVPGALRAFRAELPNVRVELCEDATAILVDGLLQGLLDAAFIRSPATRVAGLAVDSVLDEDMVLALPAAHPLATGSLDPVRLATLAAEPFILYARPAGPGLYDSIVAACRAAGFTPEVAQEAPRMPSTLSLVAAGLGISIVPSSMRRMAIDGVSYRLLAGAGDLSAPLHLALRRTGLSATSRRFRALVQRLASRP